MAGHEQAHSVGFRGGAAGGGRPLVRVVLRKLGTGTGGPHRGPAGARPAGPRGRGRHPGHARRDRDHRQRAADRQRRRQAADRRPDRQGRRSGRPGGQGRRRAVRARQPAGAGGPRPGARDPGARPRAARRCPARARTPDPAWSQGLRLQAAARRRPDQRRRRPGDAQGRPGRGRGRPGRAVLHHDPGADRRPARDGRLQARQYGQVRRCGGAGHPQPAAADLRRVLGRRALPGRAAEGDGGRPPAGHGHDPGQPGRRGERPGELRRERDRFPIRHAVGQGDLRQSAGDALARAVRQRRGPAPDRARCRGRPLRGGPAGPERRLRVRDQAGRYRRSAPGRRSTARSATRPWSRAASRPANGS